MPSREKLRAFVNHVRLLTARSAETGEDGFDREYKSLKDLQVQIKDSSDYPVSEGKLEHNRKKNRYKDILPFDFSRVALTPVVNAEGKAKPGSDYINASFLQDIQGENSYIAAMGPLTSTVYDFWRMIWLYDVKTVVMVCKEIEMGKKKCARYWAEAQEGTVSHGDFHIRLVDQIAHTDEMVTRVLEVQRSGETKMIHQFHFVSWPDHGVPDSAQPIVDLIKLFRAHQPASDSDSPVVVHCSAGCGRTGTVCAVDYAWQLLDAQVSEQEVSVLDIVTQFRHQRLSMVQTKEQYTLIYKAVLKLVKSYLAESQSVSEKPSQAQAAQQNLLYENVEITGNVAYGQKLTSLSPKKKDAPPIPMTRRHIAGSDMPVTNVDTVTAEDAEEEARLLQQITASTAGQQVCVEEEGELEETADVAAPPIPQRTQLSRQLESPDQPSVSHDSDVYASVSPGSSRSSRQSMVGESRTPDDEQDGCLPPIIPSRTRDSYILTNQQVDEGDTADGNQYAAPKEHHVADAPTSPSSCANLSLSVPTSPRPASYVGTSSSTEYLVTNPQTSGSGNSATLPNSGRHGTSNVTSPASPSSQSSNSGKDGVKRTKEVFKYLTKKNRGRTKASPSPTISPPISGGNSTTSSSSQTTGSGAIVPIFSDDMGFKNRVRRPKGPRPPPSHWRSV